MTGRSVEVAVIGGGPAGAAIATHLAAAGREVRLFERWHAPRWRAAGVYTSPLTRGRLAALGLRGDQLDCLLQPIHRMVVETIWGTRCELDYEAVGGASGVDRVRLERAMLDRASQAGAVIEEHNVVRSIEVGRPGPGRAHGILVSNARGTEAWSARLVVGADGPSSMVARAFGVARAQRRFRRAGLTEHRLAGGSTVSTQARLVIGRGWYCGVAPVPDGRVNIGIVVDEPTLRAACRTPEGPTRLVERVLDRIGERLGPPTDQLQVALPLAHRVARRAGPGFLLVGDAAGFVDPISGEGLHRALVSAEQGADAAVAWLGGRADSLERHDRRIGRRFGRKDLISWLLQAFLARPDVLDYALRRLATRDELRTTFGRVLADLDPPERALDPRFIASVLRP